MLGLGSSLVKGGVTESPIGYAALFDGTNDYGSVAYNSTIAPTAAITVSCWVNLDAEYGGLGWDAEAHGEGGVYEHHGVTETFVGNHIVGGFKIQLYRSGWATNPNHMIRANIRVSAVSDGGAAGNKEATWGGTVDTTGSTTLHEIKDFSGWIHLACTFDGATVLLYVNGSNDLYEGGGASLEDTSANQTQSTGGTGRTIPYAGNTSMKIGTDTHGLAETTVNSEYVNGAIDEVAIWDVALSSANITAIYNSGNPGIDLTDAASYDSDVTGDLQGYWKMDEGEGTTVADSSSNSNTLTLRNGPEFAAMY